MKILPCPYIDRSDTSRCTRFSAKIRDHKKGVEFFATSKLLSRMFVPIAKDSSGEMKHLAARQTSLYFLLQVFKSSYNEKVILHNEKQEL